jgi:GTP cyclohydrolase II
LYLQDTLHVDTVEASELLEPQGSRDVRTYAGVIAVLKFLGIRSDQPILLSSNNPKKLAPLLENGFSNAALFPNVVPPTSHTAQHLKAKQQRLGHINLLDDGNP